MLVLLDRDGVLVKENEKLIASPEDIELLPYVGEAMALLRGAGFKTALVTNQSIVGRGIITDPQLKHIHQALREHIARAGGSLDTILYAPDAPENPGPRRKPKPGMLIEAMQKYHARPEHTPMIGDALRDLEAAAAAGCPRYLVRTGKGAQTLADQLPDHVLPVVVCDDMLDAARKIIHNPIFSSR